MVFVADDLASWLIGLLADAGRRKLTTLILGSDQERALRSAAAAAVRLTAGELCHGDPEQAEQVARGISEGLPRAGAGWRWPGSRRCWGHCGRASQGSSRCWTRPP
jgi:hypothetical protein